MQFLANSTRCSAAASIKLSNVIERLPKDQQDQMRAAIRAAWKMNAKDGMVRLRKLADWLQRDYPEAAASLLEGLEECFNHQPSGAPAHTASLFGDHECDRELAVGCAPANWAHMSLASQHAATLGGSRLLGTEKHFRRIMGYRELWALKVILQGEMTKVDEGKGENRVGWYPAVSSYQLRAGHPHNFPWFR
jgi:putative transposase